MSDVFYGTYRDAVYPACCYFSLMDLWDQSSGYARGEVRDVVVALAHTFVDVVPIQLFNFREVLASREAKLVLGEQRRHMLEVFDQAFPRISHARNAVAHGHDRSIGKSYDPRTKEIKKFKMASNPERLTQDGKVYLDAEGNEFRARFNVEHLSAFWFEFARAVERICV